MHTSTCFLRHASRALFRFSPGAAMTIQVPSCFVPFSVGPALTRQCCCLSVISLDQSCSVRNPPARAEAAVIQMPLLGILPLSGVSRQPLRSVRKPRGQRVLLLALTHSAKAGDMHGTPGSAMPMRHKSEKCASPGFKHPCAFQTNDTSLFRTLIVGGIPVFFVPSESAPTQDGTSVPERHKHLQMPCETGNAEKRGKVFV